MHFRRPMMRARWLVLVVALGLLPGVAYAGGSKSYTFTIDSGYFGTFKRVPSSPDDDFNMPERSPSGGVLVTDVLTCPVSPGQYGVKFRRNRTGRPDETLMEFQNRSFCSVATQHFPGWPTSRFHWDLVSNLYPTPTRQGYLTAEWWGSD